MTRGLAALMLVAISAAPAAAADLEDLDFLVGHWTAEALGGVTDEIWLPARGDVMHGVFRLVTDDSLQFSEFIQLVADEDGVRMRFAHFRRDYSTWEGVDPPMNLTLAEVGDGWARFEGDERSPDIEYRVDQEQRLIVKVEGVDEPFRFRRIRHGGHRG